MTTKDIAQRPMDKLKLVLSQESVRQQFDNALRKNAGSFVASIIDLVGSDKVLQECDQNRVIMECLKAATLKLPINKSLGFAWVIPYKTKGVAIPQFQIGYKGYIQLAIRTGQYRFINAGVIFEGATVERNHLTGQVTFSGLATSDKAIGYFAYLETLSGFSKTVYMTADEVRAHAKRYSKSYQFESSAWQTNFPEMAQKTVLRLLLGKYGIMSVEMAQAIAIEDEEQEAEVIAEIKAEANKEMLPAPTATLPADIQPQVIDPGF
jgi:recombination protein RecT